ncbi:hypothetical protein PO878_07090 [Iamia majanohamensis]|uniref:Uncharacterized protein n=1 Tax=Iamia majanohamensis TaxID=467976 RepID=A0AAE9YHB6_9ACTN|nr:hypothetical protein [Iamia majanohamensis]WCO68492.1 hypothetical protein PO878_07090 [Iamia majanohamensis]
METCDYCTGEIDLHLATLLSPEAQEWRGTCARCGHVVSHLVGAAPAVAPRRAA